MMAPVGPLPSSSAVLAGSVDRAEAAVAAVAAGELVVLARGGEGIGEIVAAGVSLSDDAASFMATHGGGIIYVALPEVRCEALKLTPQNSARDPLAWQSDLRVSVDARNGISTGISAADRARTVRVASDPASSADALVHPGHIVAFATRAGGVLERADLGEAGVDLSMAAGRGPAAADCEILNPDGSRAEGADLREFARQHGLVLVEIEDIIRYMAVHTPLVHQVDSHSLPTSAGAAELYVFREALSGRTRWALAAGAHPDGDEAHLAVSPPCAGSRLLGTCASCADATTSLLDRLRRFDRAVVIPGQDFGPDCDLAQLAMRSEVCHPGWLEFAMTAQQLKALGVRRVRAAEDTVSHLAGLSAFDVEWAD